MFVEPLQGWSVVSLLRVLRNFSFISLDTEKHTEQEKNIKPIEKFQNGRKSLIIGPRPYRQEYSLSLI